MSRHPASAAQHRAFSFQVLSITAVFLALGAGLALGAAARRGPVSASLRDEVSTLTEHNGQLQAKVDWANGDVAAQEKFAEGLAPMLLGGRLSGVKVLIVSSPSGLDGVGGVRTMLSRAGATTVGILQVTAKFTDPRYEDELIDLAHNTLSSTVSGPFPTDVDGVGATSALLASVLVQRVPPVNDPDLRTVLSAYASQGYLLGAETVTAPADAVIVITGPPAAGDDATRRNAAMVTLVTQFDRAGNITVAAMDDSGAGNLVAHIRHDAALRQTVSTVDNVGTPQGRLVTAWATADQFAGRTGHYGVGESATPLPTLSP